jgi:hypothetical protein
MDDQWLGLINFYLIMASAGELTRSDFSEAELAAAFDRSPGLGIKEMAPAAEKLVLEFQSRKEDSGSRVSPMASTGHFVGETGETPDGALPLQMF